MAQLRSHREADGETEYKAIERALLESPRGRWFLSEHGRRARRLDTLTLHEAVAKLQSSLREPPALLGQLRSEIESLQSLLNETRAALNHRQTQAVAMSDGADVPAPAKILSVAEAIHELAWDLQAQDTNVEACEKIARQASQIYALSHQQAVESKRVRQLTEALDGALLRLDGLLETVALEAQFDSYNPPPDGDI
ncbi:MAG: hypothetical protein ACFCUN_02280 [Hyphomicrobiaceae bacterium]